MPDEVFFSSTLKSFFTDERILSGARAAIVMMLALVFARIARHTAVRLFSSRVKPQQVMLMRRAISYGILGLAATWSLRELGFEISVLLGAAGVLTVAVGFAAQTSVSNLISGLFLIFEQPFCVGDIIEIGKHTGEIISIDLLSVKLRTPENLFVRVPNESLLKTNVLNLTRYDTRTCVLEFAVELGQDIERVRETMLRVANENTVCLQKPKPAVVFLGYNELSMRLQLTVWTQRTKQADVKNSLYGSIIAAFLAENIALPNPYRRHPVASAQ